MEDVYFGVSLYALGVLVAMVLIAWDIIRTQEKECWFASDSYIRLAVLSLLSWVLVYFRVAAWLIDFLAYWYVWVVFKFKMWRNKRK